MYATYNPVFQAFRIVYFLGAIPTVAFEVHQQLANLILIIFLYINACWYVEGVECKTVSQLVYILPQHRVGKQLSLIRSLQKLQI